MDAGVVDPLEGSVGNRVAKCLSRLCMVNLSSSLPAQLRAPSIRSFKMV